MHSTEEKATGGLSRIFANIRNFFTEEQELSSDGNRDKSYLVWAFLLPFSFMLLIYAFDTVFPFGDRSVLVLDLNGQYVGFYAALRDWVWGDGSMLYSFARSLGGEMMGIYAYYIASPLSYIVALFPENMMTEALFFIFVLKAGLSGLTFGVYLHRNRLTAPRETVLFSTVYALTAYAVVMQHNSMWIDNLILLPLITLGIEQLVKYRRFRLFVITLSLAILSNFYIGYMMCIYVAVYYFYYSFAYAKEQVNPLGEKRHFLRSFLRMALYSAVAVGMAAIIILTVVYSLSFGKNEFSVPDFSAFVRFTPIEFFAKMLVGSYDTVEPEGLPFVYCGMLTLLLVPLYFCNRKFALREKIANAVLITFFYFSFSINTLDILWHGGQAPNWLNYRYSFMFCFLLLVLSARALTRLKDVPKRSILSVGVMLMALITLTAATGFDYFPWLNAGIALAVILLLTSLLYLWKKSDESGRRLFALLLCLVVFTEAGITGFYHLSMLHMDVGATSRNDYINYHETTGATLDWVKRYDTSFYRMETTKHRTTNDVMELGYRGVTNSTSTLNHKVITFLARMGLLSTSHWSEYKGSTFAVDCLLGIRYVVAEAQHSPGKYYEWIRDDGQFADEGINIHYQNWVYKNPYALPIAYAVSKGVNGYTFPYADPLAQVNGLVGAMTGTEQNLYLPIRVPSSDISYENLVRNDIYVNEDQCNYVELLSQVYLDNRDAYDSGNSEDLPKEAPDASITFKVKIPKDCTLYFYPPTDYRNEVAVYVNGIAQSANLFGYTGDYLRNLGKFEEGETVTVTLKMEKCLYFYYKTEANLFYYEDTDAVVSAMTSLGENGIVLDSFREDYFAGRITVTEERPTVLTTIPYDAGWIVTVDGERVETYETLDALMAFDLAPGEHSITMEYKPDCYILGRTVSLVSLGVFLVLLAYEILLRKNVIRLREGGFASRISAVFFNKEDTTPEETDWLSDELFLTAYEERCAAKLAAKKQTVEEGDATDTPAEPDCTASDAPCREEDGENE